MTGGWTPESWDPAPWEADPWADADGPSGAGHRRSEVAPGPVVVLAASGGALAATAVGLLVLLLGGVVVAVAVGALVLLGACALGSAYLRGAR